MEPGELWRRSQRAVTPCRGHSARSYTDVITPFARPMVASDLAFLRDTRSDA
jgi:hypothetical protein